MVETPQAVVDLPVEAHLPDDYVPDEAQKLELYRRLARARSAGDLAAFRQEVTDRFGPMPPPVARLVEVAELRLAAEAAGVASISREEGQLVVRFGEGLIARDGDAAAGRRRPARRAPVGRHVRLEPGPDPPAARPVAGWGLTQAVVAGSARRSDDAADRLDVASTPTTSCRRSAGRSGGPGERAGRGSRAATGCRSGTAASPLARA